MKMQKKTVVAALLTLTLPLSALATATLQNNYVLAGVSNFGTLGSNYTVSPGILFDKTGNSAYGINDFLTPGTPFEGFYISSSGGNYGANNEGTTSFSTFTLTQNSATSVTAASTSFDGLLGITNNYLLTTISGRSAIEITTTLTNKSNSALGSLSFLRTLDPDPDVNAFGSYNTTNVILSNDQACATGSSSGQTICIFTAAAYPHKAGISDWSKSPADYLAGQNLGNGDNTIGIGFNLGNLGAGESLTLTYGYALGESRDIAVGTVPEPTSALLIATGLIGMARTLRNKRTKA